LLNRRPDATERLLAFTETVKAKEKGEVEEDSWRKGALEERLAHALVKGIADYIEKTPRKPGRSTEKPLAVIEGPLMSAMNIRWRSIRIGRMFLPQVVKERARDEKAVAICSLTSKRKSKPGGGTFVKGRIVMCDRERRRPRYRQEHRRRGAVVQQL